MISMSLFALLLFATFVMVKWGPCNLGQVVLGLFLGLAMAGTVFGPPAVDALQSSATTIATLGQSTSHSDTNTIAPGPITTTRERGAGGGHR